MTNFFASSTYFHLRDGYGGHYFGELDSKKRRSGYGRCRWSNGDLYFGYWSKDKMSGQYSKRNLSLSYDWRLNELLHTLLNHRLAALNGLSKPFSTGVHLPLGGKVRKQFTGGKQNLNHKISLFGQNNCFGGMQNGVQLWFRDTHWGGTILIWG